MSKNNMPYARGSIAVFIIFFFGSAVLRIGLSATEVLAKATETGVATEQPRSEGQDAETQNAGEKEKEISTLLNAIREREKKVSRLEKELDEREKALDLAKKEIERRIIALEDTERRLSSTLAQAKSAAENDINQLIKVYESMKPKNAAALFETMEPAFAAGFIGRMRPESAAEIMAGLSPKAAYTVSVILAGQNANVPKN